MTVRFATRNGSIAYLPLYVMVDKGYLQKYIPGAKSEYTIVNSSADAATGFIGKRFDATIASTPQAIISAATGVPWKILAGNSNAFVQGITNKPEIKTLKDLKKSDHITVPTPTSINALVLYLVAKNQLGDANAVKGQTQPLAEPDAMNALIAGTTALDVAVAPSSTALLKKSGFHEVFNSEQVLPGTVGATIQVADSFGAKDAALRKGLRDAYVDALNLITSDPQQAAEIAVKDKVASDVDAALAAMKQNTWSADLKGIDVIAQLLVETKLVKSAVQASTYADPLATAGT